MIDKNHNRRQVLQGLGASLIGATGITSAEQDAVNKSGNVDIEVTDTPQWIEKNPVEGANVVDVALSVGYYGSELKSRWIDGSIKERWVHFLEACFTATCDSSFDTYNIDKQYFDTRFYDGTEHHGSPDAGSSAWPDPPLENWSEIVIDVVQGSAGALSTIASFGLSASEIIDAYGNKSFDTKQTDKIYFEAGYGGYAREDASHSVNFTADQVPNTSGTLHISSAAGDNGGPSDVLSEIYLYPEDNAMYKDPLNTTSSTESLQSTFDNMTQAQLAEYGVKRVDPNSLSKQMIRQSPFDLSGGKPVYIKSFNFDVEFGAENGSIVSTPSTKE